MHVCVAMQPSSHCSFVEALRVGYFYKSTVTTSPTSQSSILVLLRRTDCNTSCATLVLKFWRHAWFSFTVPGRQPAPHIKKSPWQWQGTRLSLPTAQQSNHKIPQGKEDFQKMKILLVPCKRRGAIARHAAASACKVTLQQAVAKCLIFEPSIPKHMSGLHSLLRNLAHRK